jgi:hypothetical protein
MALPLPSLPQFLTSVKGLSDAKADKIVEAARKMDASSGWQTGLTVAQQVRGCCRWEQ